ncbi:putative DNA-directed DNA polymerase [Gardnerella vaginalis HMP9231]|uniref:DNA polymerase n=1 Tax=Gardnerella vaginalis TaxID=2702 RepID=UPI00020CDD2C|nr:DNA polymerase [Gardnerella vaginalis]AEF30780.1 putative DNA-directed DNA polymerase [Gardnerella vaginalis HMP9231]
MENLSVDLETFSSVNLGKCGVYKYAESDDFEILLFGYSVDGSEVQVVDLAQGETIPEVVLSALTDETVTKWAFNAQFERVCLSRYLRDKGINVNPGQTGKSEGLFLNPCSWHCTMIWSATLGLPMSLESVGTVLGLDKQKLTSGKSLIKYFCLPCNPTKVNGGRTRNKYFHDKEKWEQFKSYNKRDVEVEMSIQEKLSRFPVPDFLWQEFYLDQEINDRGIGIDSLFVESAIKLDQEVKTHLVDELKHVTGLENPNSVLQMRSWLKKHGLEMESLGKKEVAKELKTVGKELAEVLRLRQQLAKSSVKKYTAMKNAACMDYRERGMFRFYGANRTGRFAGRLVQLQNLPQNHLPDLAEARSLVKQGNVEALEMLYEDIPDTLSQLIRTAFIPRTGLKFIVADFSAIEARVLAWLAGEKWRMRVFAEGKDIYCSSASQMFSVPVEKHGVNGHLRQKGKIAELALGYGGSVGALKAMGALDMGVREDELQPLVDAWRSSNPMVTTLWWDVDRAVKQCVHERISVRTHNIVFTYKSGFLIIKLPSKRCLYYVKPRVEENKYGGESVTYEGVGSTKKWERLESYGPKFVENITQAIARDILLYAMQTLKEYRIVAHVHDEAIIETDKNVSVQSVCELMGRTPPWAEGLVLRADGYECEFYKKD